MIHIFIEAERAETPESVFIRTLLEQMGVGAENYVVQHVGGKDKLQKITSVLKVNRAEGNKNVVIFDADKVEKGDGFEAIQRRIQALSGEEELIDGLFLFPNNQDDGTFETLLETLIPSQHKHFFDCFSDYEQCVGEAYRVPDLKSKLYTYITSQREFSNTQLKTIGKKGQYMFADERYWNLDAATLLPLKKFLQAIFNHV